MSDHELEPNQSTRGAQVIPANIRLDLAQDAAGLREANAGGWDV